MESEQVVMSTNGTPHVDFEAPPPPKDAFTGRWRSLAVHPDWLTTDPPPQRWLMTRSDRHRDIGVLPRGRAGVLVGAGGISKTYAVVQLAIAVALGGFWLDRFRIAEPGHVLLALAEEDEAEVRRRLWRACNAAGLSADERQAVAERIDVAPLAGVDVALTCGGEGGALELTDAAKALRKRLESRGVDWALVVLDPLARWAAGGTEKDNELATRFVQLMESLATVQGDPFVLGCHHSSKVSIKDGASDSRGVSGLRDGLRWMAVLDAIERDGLRAIRLRNHKSNLSPLFPDMLLLRSDEPGTEGTLRPASETEAEDFRTPDRAEALDTTRRERTIADAEVLRDVIAKSPGATMRDLIASARAKGLSRDRTYAALAELGDTVERRPGKRDAQHHYIRGSQP